MPAGLKLEFDFDEFLRSVGLSGETINRIRLGRGVVSRVSSVAALAMIALGMVAYKATDEKLLVGVIVAIAGLFLIYLFSVLRFSAKHKELALLEGAELLAWRQMEIRAKTVPIPPQQPILADPGTKAISAPDDDPVS